MTYDHDPKLEAAAEAWASIDGKLDKFLAGRGKPHFDQPGGYYGGYLEDARELLERIRARGYELVELRADGDENP